MLLTARFMCQLQMYNYFESNFVILSIHFLCLRSVSFPFLSFRRLPFCAFVTQWFLFCQCHSNSIWLGLSSSLWKLLCHGISFIFLLVASNDKLISIMTKLWQRWAFASFYFYPRQMYDVLHFGSHKNCTILNDQTKVDQVNHLFVSVKKLQRGKRNESKWNNVGKKSGIDWGEARFVMLFKNALIWLSR